jgi:hypothetical protein
MTNINKNNAIKAIPKLTIKDLYKKLSVPVRYRFLNKYK